MFRLKKARFAKALPWIQLPLGLVLAALGYSLFLVPGRIAAGGFTGIGQLVNAYTGWPVGAISIALNLPLFAISMRQLGVTFGVRSLVSMVVMSLLIDHMPVPTIESEPLLSAVFGGAISGAGLGLVLRSGATTGGSDMLGKLVARRFPVFSIGSITFAVDALVIIASSFVFDAYSAMLALVAAFLMNRMLDTVLQGFAVTKAYYIISDKSEEISSRILTELERGVTGLHGRGMYSGENRTVLLCVLDRMETAILRRIVHEVDPSAFMIATDVHEVLGEGFEPRNP